MTTTFLKVVCDIVLVCMLQEESFSGGLLPSCLLKWQNRKIYSYFTFLLGMFTKLWKMTINFIRFVCVCVCVCLSVLAPIVWIVMKFDILSIF